VRLEDQGKKLSNIAFQNLGYGVSDIVRLSEEFRAPRVSISFSMGHQGLGGMILDRSLALVRQLRELAGNHRDEVTAIEIAGTDDGNEKVVLDLIEERMTNVLQVQPAENRTIPYNTRRQALREAWANRREDLIQMFQGA
jgi:hypothetical protein